MKFTNIKTTHVKDLNDLKKGGKWRSKDFLKIYIFEAVFNHLQNSPKGTLFRIKIDHKTFFLSLHKHVLGVALTYFDHRDNAALRSKHLNQCIKEDLINVSKALITSGYTPIDYLSL